MIRIVEDRTLNETTITLEGKLLAAWVEVVREHGLRALRASHRVRLNLSGVSFVDEAGEQALRALRMAGVEIATSSPFVAELLDREMTT